MNNTNVVVDIKSIASTKKMMDSDYTMLLDMFNKYKQMIEETKSIYDTESATLYRTVATGYLDLIEKYLNNDFKPYIDKLDEISNIYTNEFNAVSQSIGGETI